MKNLFILSEEEKNRILNLHESATKRHYLTEQFDYQGLFGNYKDPFNLNQNTTILQGVNGDPYQYKKSGDKFWYAKKSEGNTPKWIEAKNPKAIEDIKNNIFTKGKFTKSSKNNGFILIWAFPEYQPKVDGKSGWTQLLGSLIRVTSGGGNEGTYGKLGHGGCVIVKSNGDATCYEFGRYPGAKKGYGKVLSYPLGKIGKIKNGVLINAEDVAKIAKGKTFPPGPSMRMSVVVVKLPNPSEAIKYAAVKEREYTALDFSIGDEDANCGTFTLDVAKSGGIQLGSHCFPTPIAAVNSFKKQSDSFFEV